MNKKFTASNGLVLTPRADGSVRWEAGHDPVVVTKALREFFQAERDGELGLWRSKASPGWTAVKVHTTVYFQHDDHQRGFHFVVGNSSSLNAWSPDLVKVAHEYLKAHPEPKPWHDAKPGEVWALTTDRESGEHAWGVDPEFGGGRFVHVGGLSNLPFDHPDIIAGRRIWPEAS